MALKNNQIWIVETKLIYGTKVVEQAYAWQKFADFVSIATPRTMKKNIVLDFFIEQKGIGLFWVAPNWNSDHFVHLKTNPVQNNAYLREEIIKSLHPEQKISIAGSKGGGYVTAYKLTIDAIRELLKNEGPQELNQLVTRIKHHYANNKSAINTLKQRLVEVETEFELFKVENKNWVRLKPSP